MSVPEDKARSFLRSRTSTKSLQHTPILTPSNGPPWSVTSAVAKVTAPVLHWLLGLSCPGPQRSVSPACSNSQRGPTQRNVPGHATHTSSLRMWISPLAWWYSKNSLVGMTGTGSCLLLMRVAEKSWAST